MANNIHIVISDLTYRKLLKLKGYYQYKFNAQKITMDILIQALANSKIADIDISEIPEGGNNGNKTNSKGRFNTKTTDSQGKNKRPGAN